MNLDFRYVLQRFWHRFPWFLIVAVAVTALSVTLAMVLPPVYRAKATLLVESPQISADLAASTVNTGANETLQIIEQHLMARDTLLDLASKMKIYDGQPPMTDDKIVDDMRRRITIVLPDGSSAASFASVSFDASTGQQSADVTSEIVRRLLQENISLRTASATQTLDFFKQETDTLGTQLGKLGGKIMQFKLDHKDALPDSLEFRRTRQASQQERLVQIQREIASLKDRRTRLVDIFRATGNVDTASTLRTPEEIQLQDAKNQLAAAQALYSPQHPTVVALKAKVTALEAAMNGGQTATPTTSGGEQITGNSTFDLQIADIDSQITFDTDQQTEIEKELADLQTSIDATPSNAIDLDAIQRDFDNVKTQYDDAVARMGQAQTGDRIESLSKGQRITVIDEAVVPTQPTSPKRKAIAIGGGLAGLFLGLGLVTLLELLNRTVRRPGDLAARLGIQAFGTVPYIQTRKEVLHRRLVLTSVLLAAIIGIPAILFAVHQYVIPLDLLVGRVIGKA